MSLQQHQKLPGKEKADQPELFPDKDASYLIITSSTGQHEIIWQCAE